MTESSSVSSEAAIIEHLRSELAKSEPTRRRRIIEMFVLAALGSIPWVGGFLSAAASYKINDGSLIQDSLQTQWLEEHHKKILQLRDTLEEVQARFEKLGSAIEDRLQSEEYLGLVRKAFRIWDAADTQEKRRYVANIVTNSAGTRVCSDDVVRLFLDWIERYHEVHFAVVREVFQNPGSTRFEIWTNLYGETLRDDSAEADLFKLLMHDLSVGHVLRQERDVNQLGQFVRKTPRRTPRGGARTTIESAFEDSKAYVLTELGKQFVHYTMSEVVARIEEGRASAG